MSRRSESADSDAERDAPGAGSDQPRARKRQRVRLSCLECRRRKLSCDRGFPCERCIKSGTSDRCSYEARNGEVVRAAPGVVLPFGVSEARRLGLGLSNLDGFSGRDDHERLRPLEQELEQLKSRLRWHGGSGGSSGSYDGSTAAETSSPAADGIDGDDGGSNNAETAATQECLMASSGGGGCGSDNKGELRFFRGKGFRTRYFGPQNASTAFIELTGLCPFMRETADEWLRPLALHEAKDRRRRAAERDERAAQPDAALAALVPGREEADALVEVYLEQLEAVHRIVHIPTFRADYAGFWAEGDGRRRGAALTALVLCVLAVASSVHSTGAAADGRRWAERCLAACDGWLARQSQKHRTLVHFQVGCLVYLGRRAHTIKKKRFWTGAGALVRDSVAVGLHREPSRGGGGGSGSGSGSVGPYGQEMRRRIWATVQDLDVQASLDHGLPTLLGQLPDDTHPPRNLDDGDFGPQSAALPASRPAGQWTAAAFQHLARRSLRLRLELGRVLAGAALGEADYERVLRLTSDLTRELDALPGWDVDEPGSGSGSGAAPGALIAHTLLQVQLRQYLIPLHQPYLALRRRNSRYHYSELVYYHAARDMVLLHDRLHRRGVRALSCLREDALTTAINLCSVTMLQPRGSSSIVMANAPQTLRLVDKCIAIKEDRLLRSGNSEPWGYAIMCAALGLLEAHLGTKTPEAAKATTAERFVKLHQRLKSTQAAQAAQEPPAPAAPTPPAGLGPGLPLPDRAKSVTPLAFDPTLAAAAVDMDVDVTAPSAWILGGAGADDQALPFNLDPSLELLGLNLNELWGESWELC